MAAVVFGIEKPLHLKGLPWRQTESINSGVFEEEPYIVNCNAGDFVHIKKKQNEAGLLIARRRKRRNAACYDSAIRGRTQALAKVIFRIIVWSLQSFPR